MQDRAIWVFGYGSLVWRPAFPFLRREPARLAGWSRRFWQGSTDHRGVPGAPGRVVTLVRDPGQRCDGVAYQVESAEVDGVLATLDHREQGGYDRHIVRLSIDDGAIDDALVYVATEENVNYLGPAPPDEIAETVIRSAGPSGANAEYVTQLAHALRALGAVDEHVFEIERRVLAYASAAG